MIGTVDDAGRALLEVALRALATHAASKIVVWIDTGFTGDLVIPQSIVDQLGLAESGSVDAVLADGSRSELKTFTSLISWLGTDREIEVIANDGQFPLLGVGLLLGCEFRVNYQTRELTISPG